MTRRPVRILITGSRSWTDQRAIAHAISDYLHSVGSSIGGAWPLPIVVHGGARGADRLADVVARNWGWTPEPHPADWARYGRSAGYRRNAAMVALGADVCLAFIRGDSAGATHTAALAEAAGIPTRRYRMRTGVVNNLVPGRDVPGKSGSCGRANGEPG
jgi:hypothetical protein